MFVGDIDRWGLRVFPLSIERPLLNAKRGFRKECGYDKARTLPTPGLSV